jgi:O-antigen/teichoic acid export membrane protein
VTQRQEREGVPRADEAEVERIARDAEGIYVTGEVDPEMPGLGKTAIRGISWTVLKSTSTRLVTSVVFVILARLLDPADFGTVALASVFIILISVLVESGFGEAIIQRKELKASDLNSAFWVNNAIGVVLAIVLIATADLIAQSLGQPELAPVLRGLSAVFVLSGLASVPQAILRRDLAFRAIALRGFAGTLAGGLVGIGMALAGAGVWSLVGQMIVTSIVGTATLWAMCSWRPGTEVSVRSLNELFGFSVRILGQRLAYFASRRADDFLVGVVLGPVALGLYSVAYRVLTIVTETVIWTVDSVAFPLLSRLQNDAERRRQVFLALTGLCVAAAVPTFLALSVLAPELTRLAFGEQWLSAIPVMQILALAGIPYAVLHCNKAALNAGGEADLSLRIAILTCVMNVLGFALVVQWGIVAVAGSLVVCSFVLVPISLRAVTRTLVLDVKSYLPLLLAPLLSGGVMVAAMIGVKMLLGDSASDFLRLFISLVVAALTYCATFCLTSWAQVQRLMQYARRDVS